MGFVRGLLAPFRGAAYVVRKGLWAYLIGPFVLSSALAVAAGVLAVRYWRGEAWISDLLASSPPVGWVVLVVLSALGAVVLFLIAQPLLLAVFNDRLSERVERDIRGVAPNAPFLASTGQAIVHGLLKLVLYGLALVVGLGLTALTGVGSLVGLALAGLFLAYDGFDYPLSRRSAGFGAKWAYLMRNPAQTIGYGVGATVLYLIPLAILVAPPFAAAGATLAYLDAESRAGSKAPQKTPPKSPGNVAATT